MASRIIIADYNDQWPVYFARYRDELRDLDDGWLERIEHVGSTSVPGLAAKPVIDILVGVTDPALIDVSREPVVQQADGQNVEPKGPAQHIAMVNAIKGLGYVYRGENTIPGRLLFGHRDIEPPCHIHLVLVGSEFWDRHLLFRDYLREHREAADAYARLKRELAERFRNERIKYTDAKTDFIRECERKAQDWRTGQS